MGSPRCACRPLRSVGACVLTGSLPGNGFATFHLPPPLGTVTLAICMDLNVIPPAEWNLDEGPYEVAEHCIATKSNLLILLNAWLDSDDDEDRDMDWRTMNYWSVRLRPLWAQPLVGEHGNHVRDTHAQPEEETVVVVCNRYGEENGMYYLFLLAMYSDSAIAYRSYVRGFIVALQLAPELRPATSLGCNGPARGGNCDLDCSRMPVCIRIELSALGFLLGKQEGHCMYIKHSTTQSGHDGMDKLCIGYDSMQRDMMDIMEGRQRGESGTMPCFCL